MKKLYSATCGKYRISITCSKCKNEDKKIFKDKESIKILKMFTFIKNI